MGEERRNVSFTERRVSVCFTWGFSHKRKRSKMNFYQDVSTVEKNTFSTERHQCSGEPTFLSSGEGEAEPSWDVWAAPCELCSKGEQVVDEGKSTEWLPILCIVLSHSPNNSLLWPFHQILEPITSLNLVAPGTAEQCPPHGEGLSHVARSPAVSAGMLCCSKASHHYFYRRLSMASFAIHIHLFQQSVINLLVGLRFPSYICCLASHQRQVNEY